MAVVVRRGAQVRQCGNDAPGHISQFFLTISGGKAMQHAVVAAHIEHAGAAFVGTHKRRIALEQRVARRCAGVPHVGIDDVALAAFALAVGFGAGVASGVYPL